MPVGWWLLFFFSYRKWCPLWLDADLHATCLFLLNKLVAFSDVFCEVISVMCTHQLSRPTVRVYSSLHCMYNGQDSTELHHWISNCLNLFFFITIPVILLLCLIIKPLLLLSSHYCATTFCGLVLKLINLVTSPKALWWQNEPLSSHTKLFMSLSPKCVGLSSNGSFMGVVWHILSLEIENAQVKCNECAGMCGGNNGAKGYYYNFYFNLKNWELALIYNDKEQHTR